MPRCENSIDKVQRRGLKILLEIDRICKKHGITYFLESGTLLGAVRHGGFIPWDDDIDISMLRDDYERFIQVATEELPKQYFVQTNESDSYYPFGFAKIIDTKTKLINDKKNKFREGLCVDVFPIDNAHDNKYIHKLNIFIIKIIQGLTKSKVTLDMKNYDNFFIKSAIKIASLAGKLFSTRFLLKLQKKVATSNNDKKTKYKCIFSYPFSYLDNLYPSSAYEDIEELNFEGYMFPAPKGWNEILTIQYDDYMTLPPLEQRKPTHRLEHIKFLDEE
ncbi:MAG TPA: LicD family protein [Clostridiales bacterium]|nr:LicD family protein [Clostridiales bacterium]